jgi:putative flippase GtrA
MALPHKIKIRKFLRFSAVGVTATVMDFAAMIALTEACGINPLISAAISFLGSTALNYAGSMRFVFSHRDELSRHAEFVIFCILTGVGLGINEAIMATFLAFTRISYILCKVIAALIVSLWNYFSRKRWLDSDPTALPPSRSERDGA